MYALGFIDRDRLATCIRSVAKSQPSEEHTHLRFRIVVWTSLKAVQEAVGQDVVIMWRQKASDVVFPDNMERISRDLAQGCKQLQGFHYQIVLRELQTLSGAFGFSECLVSIPA